MKNFNRVLVVCLLWAIFLSVGAHAEVLTMNLNAGELKVGETLKVFGNVLDDTYGGSSGISVDLYIDDIFKNNATSDDEGYYEFFISDFASGNHNVTINTSLSAQRLTFSAFTPTLVPSYQIIASSLVVPYSSPSLSFTVQKYLGTTLSSDAYSLKIFNENGSIYTTTTGISNVAKTVTLPQMVGIYTLTVDDKKSFTASVTKFSLKYKITDVAGEAKDVFQPGKVAYFEVEGYSNGQKITGATVSAKVTSPAGKLYTVTFSEASGLYRGNTNVTATGTPIVLSGGNYDVEFTMKDSSNNEQKMKGFFTVYGISVDLKLVNKKPYRAGQTADFTVLVRKLSDGTMLSHSDVVYSVELEKEGKIYDAAGLTPISSTDPGYTSKIAYTVPEDLADGNYFVKVKATSAGKIGRGKDFIKIQNTDLFIDLTDNYGGFRDFFQPGELAKITARSNSVISFLKISVYNKEGVLQSQQNTTGSLTSLSKGFNVPTTQKDYYARVQATIDGTVYSEDRWFSVQNYMSFLDVRSLDNLPRFVIPGDESFLGAINVFDVAKGQGVDLTGFVTKFDKIVNEETQVQYTNIKATENVDYTDKTTGRVVYTILPLGLSQGFYRIEYTLVDSKGKSFKGKGFFQVSELEVNVFTYSTGSLLKSVFSSGETVNVTVTCGSGSGTATINRQSFPQKQITITNGKGWTLLTKASSELPTESGFYPFGVDVQLSNSKKGLGGGFFEIKNLNFKNINVRGNGEITGGNDISVDVTIEKSGTLIEGAAITLERMTNARSGQTIGADSNTPSTDSQGRATLVITPPDGTEPGNYFADVKATKDGDTVFAGVGFQIVGDKVIITIDDEDRKFSSTENININVKVTNSNDVVQSNVPVNLIGLMNLNTWGPVSASKSANTSSNGIATLTIAASNFNPGRYAPIVNVSTIGSPTIGFGLGEFEIKPFDVTVEFAEGSSFQPDEDIEINIEVVGTVTVTAAVTDVQGNTENVDYYYSDGVLTINNNLDAGEYFVDVTITSSTKSYTARLWFEVKAPWAQIRILDNRIAPDESLNFNYSVFTMGATGWNEATGLIVISQIQNLWTGATTDLEGENFSATGSGQHSLDMGPFDLSTGDYLLKFTMDENPQYNEAQYFRLERDIRFNRTVEIDGNNATITVTATGLSENANFTLNGYTNFQNGVYTSIGTTTENGIFNLNGLQNGFYQTQFLIRDGTDRFYYDVPFEIDLRAVHITAPATAYVGDDVVFTIDSSIMTTFWVIDPFTQSVKKKEAITPSTESVTYRFTAPGRYVYNFGANKWDAFNRPDQIEIRQRGFDVTWPMRNLFIKGENLTFNVSTPLTNTNMTLRLKSHFTGQTQTLRIGKTSAVADQIKHFAINITMLGPQDVELTLDTSEGEKPKSMFFMDVFPDNYKFKLWTDGWEFKSGQTVTLRADAFNILTNMRMTLDNFSLLELKDSYGSAVDVAELVWTPGQDYATIATDSDWTSGNYHARILLESGEASRTLDANFFVRGNDNIQLFWNQNKWDFTGTEEFALTVEARDNGKAAAGVRATLDAFQLRPASYDDQPQDVELPDGSYHFSTSDNKTNVNGKIIFYINLSHANLETGGYNGRLIVGGQMVWFDINLRAYRLDAYTSNWEYGITDTIQLNVRARDINTGVPLDQDGNVKILEIRKHDNQNWNTQPETIALSALGLATGSFDVVDGSALIEMLANNTVLQFDRPYELEISIQMNLTTGGVEKGFVWFRLSNTAKPELTIVDRTGEVPSSFFGGQTYTLKLTGPENMSATLRNIWGPESRNYNTAFSDDNGTLELNFTSPQMQGMYNVEVEFQRSEGYSERMNENFLIGSGTQLKGWTGGNVMPGMNFTITMDLFGEGRDPWCQEQYDPHCADRQWYGPLTNQTIVLAGIRDLSTFTYTSLPGLGISGKTESFPMRMLPTGTMDPGQMANCPSIFNEEDCNAEEDCGFDGTECYYASDYCGKLDTEEACNAAIDAGKSCDYGDMEGCFYNDPNRQQNQQNFFPGQVAFTLDPDDLGMQTGKKYDLVFTYTNDEEDVTEGKVFVQVEAFHVPIVRRIENLAANSEQQVWLKTTDLDGEPIPDCSIRFTGVYNAMDNSIIKALSINDKTDVNGEMEFTYTAPSLPGDFMVEGRAICELSGVNNTQELAYYIEIGSKNLNVDMKTNYNDGDNIKVVITTLDRLGQPKSQRLDLQLYHRKSSYQKAIYPSSNVGCTALDAAPKNGWDQNAQNMLSLSTDETGQYELELCPLPQGSYDLQIFPIYDSGGAAMGGGGSMGDAKGGTQGNMKGEDDFGFFGTFKVSSINVEVNSELTYIVGDEVSLIINTTDAFGQPVAGNITALEIGYEKMGTGITEGEIKEYTLSEIEESIELVDGDAVYSFTIPSSIDDDGNETEITFGPAFVKVLITDSGGVKHSYEGLQFAIVSSELATITADESVLTNSLIAVNVSAPNEVDQKAQFGVFFLMDNPDKDKPWMIENGVLLRETSETTSGAGFKVLTPAEPGEYYLAIPLVPKSVMMSKNIDPMVYATDLLITPINVKLDFVIANGTVLDLSGDPVEKALVRIGKAEGFTDNLGKFSLEIPRGKKSVLVERKVGSLRQYIKTQQINFNTNKELDVTLYEVELSGALNNGQPLFNITSPGYDLSTTKLKINVTVDNLGQEDLLGFAIRGIAQSGEELRTADVSADSIKSVFLSKLYAGFKVGEYDFKIKFEDENWNSLAYVLANGVGVNSTVGAILTKRYQVDTYVVAGNGIDDDGDGKIDEEMDNGKDDDGDGLIDEDLMATAYVEFCGNGFCSMQEKNGGNCFEDCAKGPVCGDNNCAPEEKINCPGDCAGQVETCQNKGTCNPDGTFCNNFGAKEPAAWCQTSCNDNNCWACNMEECEAVGCSAGTDQMTDNEFCFKEMTCGSDSCKACGNQESCTGTGVCTWRQDSFSTWCERPWTCDVECGACQGEDACFDSPAEMNGNGCRWKQDNRVSWCEWNMSFMPPKGGGSGIIDNVWLSAANDSGWINSLYDWKCWSGRCSGDHAAGEYYIMLHMGNTRVNISVNGIGVAIVDNTQGVWRDVAIAEPYHFTTNGSYTVEVTDLIGPDHVEWDVVIGHGAHSVCGDGVRQGSEQCDLSDLNSNSCISIPGGFSGGTLSCKNNCTFNTSACTRGDEGYPELELNTAGTGVSENGDNLVLTFKVDNLSESPWCGAEFDIQGATYEMWIAGLNTKPGEGCTSGVKGCYPGSDYTLSVAKNTTDGYLAYFQRWNQMEESLDLLTHAGSESYNCGAHTVTITIPKTSIEVEGCDNISVAFSTGIKNGSNIDQVSQYIPPEYVIDGFCEGLFSNELSDDTDGATAYYVGNNINFFANLTDTETGEPLSGPGIYCLIRFDLSYEEHQSFLMFYNTSSHLYKFNRSFLHPGFSGWDDEWGVNCNVSGEMTGWLSNTFEITNRAPVLLVTVPNQTWPQNTQLIGSDLDNYFVDPDSDPLNFSVVEIVDNITIYINETTHIVTFVPDTGWSGQRTVVFRAEDPFYYPALGNEITLTVVAPELCQNGDEETCLEDLGCGWATPPEQPEFCLPCSEMSGTGLGKGQIPCESSGCTWDAGLTECEARSLA